MNPSLLEKARYGLVVPTIYAEFRQRCRLISRRRYIFSEPYLTSGDSTEYGTHARRLRLLGSRDPLSETAYLE